MVSTFIRLVINDGWDASFIRRSQLMLLSSHRYIGDWIEGGYFDDFSILTFLVKFKK
jgi:hypothetical protein